MEIRVVFHRINTRDGRYVSSEAVTYERSSRAKATLEYYHARKIDAVLAGGVRVISATSKMATGKGDISIDTVLV